MKAQRPLRSLIWKVQTVSNKRVGVGVGGVGMVFDLSGVSGS